MKESLANFLEKVAGQDEYSQSSQMDESDRNRIILGITVKPVSTIVKRVGLFVCDLVDYSLKIAEISDNEFYTQLESVILQVNPSTCVLMTTHDPLDTKRVNHVISSCNLHCTEHTYMGSRDYLSGADEANISTALEFLLKGEDSLRNHVKELSLKLGLQSFLQIINSFPFLSRKVYGNKFTLSTHSMENYLSMDRAAFLSLAILPNTKSGSSTSLYSILNKCRTTMGSQLLKIWVSQPLTDVEEIRKRHDCVEAFKESLYRVIQAECLRKVPDLDAILVKFRNYEMTEEDSKGNGTLSESDRKRAELYGLKPVKDEKNKVKPTFEDLVLLYDCIVAVNRMVQFVLKPYDGINSSTVHLMFTEPLLKASSMFETYLRLVEKTVDLKESEKRNYVINRNFDPLLTKLANDLDHTRNEMERLRNSIEDELSLTNYNKKRTNAIKIVECNTMGFLFRVSKKDQVIVQSSNIPGITIEKVRLNKNEFLFTTSRLRKLCSTFKTISERYQESQLLLVNKTFRVASTYWVLLEGFLKTLAMLDVITAFAEVAAIYDYVKPEIDERNQEIKLSQARHPLVEYVLSSKRFVPNDLDMDRDESRIHITTGPNMGGKSTYIKQVGLIAIMNQIGSFVPCSYARIPVFKHVLCRIGASDIQARGVSTFLAEMVESAAILRIANEHSLVIIDELGRGTSTHDGFGLAWAIVVDLIQRAKCFCLCATHFHEMGHLANEFKGVVNKHLTSQFFEDQNAMTFLYKISDGVSKKSFGINVAMIANFPNDVVENARKKLNELEGHSRSGVSPKLQELFQSQNFEEFCTKIPILLSS